MKIVIDSKIPFVRGVFEPYANVEYLDAADITPSAVRFADALIVRTRTPCSAALLDGARVRFIASATIGADHIDADFCRSRNIAWTNAAGCNAGAVLQYTAAALLTAARRRNIVLHGKTIGIVGVGNVGRRVAEFARSMGMLPLLCDPPRAEAEGGGGFVPLHQIAEQAHVITLHPALTRTGRHPSFRLADAEFFARLALRPVFINTSRGETADEGALRRALLCGRVSAAVLDVWENEPCINADTLRLADIGTPHIAGYSAEGKARASQMAVRAVARFLGLPLEQWRPPALPPVAVPAIDRSLPLQERMYRFVRHFYNIEADDAALRSSPHDSERLRSQYVLRREAPATQWCKM